MTNTKIKQFIILGGLATVMVFFQNCGQQASFSEDANRKLSSTGDLVVVNDGPGGDILDSTDPLMDDQDGSNDSFSIDDPLNTDDSPENEQNVVNNDHDKDGPTSDGKKEKDCKKDNKAKGKNPVINDKSMYRCVLEGKGKSTHIGFLNNKVAVDKDTPDTLCMSKRACLEIMGSRFNVKEAKFTGYCKNNKAHTIQITDAQATDLVLEN